jgi:cell fate (sporulation/competence/biofilm development) regulator YmcA (YheA/YmcA/DUF963 family)
MGFKDIDLDENIIFKNKIPLLIEDKSWVALFGNIDNKDIQNIKEELAQMVEKQKQLDKMNRTLQKEKLHAMKMILGISDAVNNENKIETIGLLDEYKKKIEEANEQIDEIIFQLETIPQSIRELNFDLLKATVYYGYKELKDKEKKLKSVTEELEALRKRLQELINEKYDYEEFIDATYSFLHGMLGNEETEKLDRKILE